MLTSDQKLQFAIDLRKKPTPAEALLWDHIQKVPGLRERCLFQHIIQGYIVDFFFVPRLCVEVDGSIHDDRNRLVRDKLRECHLITGSNAVFLRFSNAEVMTSPELVTSIIEGKLALLDRSS